MAEDIVKLINGDTISRNQIVNSNINYYQQAYEENLTDICDFSEGSEIRTLHESIAVDIINMYRTSYAMHLQNFLRYATGAYLDTKAYDYGLTRKGSQSASGTVTFTLTDALSSDYIIPQGTIILSKSEGYEYALTSNVTIAAGTLSADGTVVSTLTGSIYNALPDTLTAFKDIITIRQQVSVTNNDVISGGVDAETDEEFKARILDSLRQKTYGTAPTYETLIKNEVDGIHDIQFVDPKLLTTSTAYPTHYKPGSTTEVCTDCVNVVFINSTSKPCPQKTLNEVEYVLKQQDNLIIGHDFHIEAALVIPIYLHIHLYVTAKVDEKVIVTALEAFFNGEDLNLGDKVRQYKGLDMAGTLYKYELINMLEDLPSVSQVGDIQRLKYNTNIPQDLSNSGWTKNGDGGYTYLDSQGYTYYREDEKVKYDYWGERNFEKITYRSGTILALGNMSSIDSNTVKVIELEQTIVKE